MSNRDPDHAPILITDAQQSYDDELATRKRRYALMMGMRVPCLVVAAMLYNHPWIAAGLILLSVPLPWMAVIIANDRLPRKAAAFQRYRDEPTGTGLESGRPTPAGSLESGDHQVIESPDAPQSGRPPG